MTIAPAEDQSRPSGQKRRQGQKTCQDEFTASLQGRPRGRGVKSNPRRVAMRAVQRSVPGGAAYPGLLRFSMI